MRFISLSLLLLCAAFAFGADCNTAGFACINMDSQIKGSRLPSFGVDAGAANAYSVTTIAPLGPALKPGSSIMFFASHGNTGSSTLAVDGGSAIALKTMGLASLSSGMIGIGGFVYAIYDGTQFQCITCASGASTSSGSFSNTGLPGPSAAPTVTTTGTTGAATYTYCVVANLAVGTSSSGGMTSCSPAKQVTNGNATLTSSNFTNISWTAVPGASNYDVYRTFSTGTPATNGKLTTGDCPATTSTNCHDKGETADGNPAPAINSSGQTVAASYATAGGFGIADPRYQVILKDEFCGASGDLGWTTTGSITVTQGRGTIGVNDPCVIEFNANSTIGTFNLGNVLETTGSPNGAFNLAGGNPLVMRVYAKMTGGFSTSGATTSTNQAIGLTSTDGFATYVNPVSIVTFLGSSPVGTYTHFGCYIGATGLTHTYIDTGVPQDTNWHWFELDITPSPVDNGVNPSGNAILKIDHTTVCSATGLVFATHRVVPFIGVGNFSSTNGTMQVDYFDLNYVVYRP